MGGMMLIGCKSNAEKQADAIENVDDANQDLEDVETDAMKKANDQEWQTYKAEANKTAVAFKDLTVSNKM